MLEELESQCALRSTAFRQQLLLRVIVAADRAGDVESARAAAWRAARLLAGDAEALASWAGHFRAAGAPEVAGVFARAAADATRPGGTTSLRSGNIPAPST